MKKKEKEKLLIFNSMNLIEKVIAVDMDGTLCEEECWTAESCRNATPKKEMVDWVSDKYQKNFVVIYTARRDENIPATLEWLRRNNIRYHAISNIKTPTDILIDDRAMNPKDI